MSVTTDCVSSPVWSLFAKKRNRSGMPLNSFSQAGVMLRFPLGSSACGAAWSALSSLATGALISVITDFSSEDRSFVSLRTSAATTITNSGTSKNKSASCLRTRPPDTTLGKSRHCASHGSFVSRAIFFGHSAVTSSSQSTTLPSRPRLSMRSLSG
jgi:hypothetical protein